MKVRFDDRHEHLPMADAIRGTVQAVQFYETDDYLLQTLVDYVAGAFAAGDPRDRRGNTDTAPLGIIA